MHDFLGILFYFVLLHFFCGIGKILLGLILFLQNLVQKKSGVLVFLISDVFPFFNNYFYFVKINIIM